MFLLHKRGAENLCRWPASDTVVGPASSKQQLTAAAAVADADVDGLEKRHTRTHAHMQTTTHTHIHYAAARRCLQQNKLAYEYVVLFGDPILIPARPAVGVSARRKVTRTTFRNGFPRGDI